MAQPLRVLMVEDSEADAQLLALELERIGYVPEWVRVDTPATMRAALARQAWDVVLADVSLPHFSALAALRLLQELERDVPFIIVSGTIGEETAVELMRAGAHDFVLKGTLMRLGAIIDRERREAGNRQERRHAQAEVIAANRILRLIASINEAILRARGEGELLRQVCEIAVDVGGYRMVWVGFVEHDREKHVRPICFAGHEDGYLAATGFSWAEGPLGGGPTGVAIRTGLPASVEDIADTPAYAPWRAAALARGYRSSIAVPLLTDHRVLGVFSFYLDHPAVVSAVERQLLTELAHDIGYGIMTLRAHGREKRAEAALRASEERLRAVLDTLPVGVVILDAAGRGERHNAAFTRIWAGNAPDIPPFTTLEAARHYHGWWAESGAPLAWDEWAAVRALRHGETSVGEVVDIARFDGSRGTILNNATPLRDAAGAITGVVVVIQDISALRQAEDALRAQRAFLRTVIDSVPNFIGVKDIESRFVLANRALAEVYGTTPEAIIGKSDADFNPNADEVAWFHRDDLDVIQHCRAKSIPQEKVTDSTGRVRWLTTVKIPLLEPDGTCARLLLATHDITERVQAEAALKTSEEQYRTLFAIEPDALILFDADAGQFLDVNDAALQMYGFSREEFMVRMPADFSVEPAVTQSSIATTGIGQTFHILLRYHRRKDGSIFPVEINGRVYALAGHKVIFVAIRDITERVQTEAVISRERAYLASAMDVLPIPILFITPEAEIFRSNPASQMIVRSLPNAHWREELLLYPDTRVEIPLEQRPFARALRGEVVAAQEAIAVPPDGREMPVLLYAAPIYVGERLVAAVVAIQDITALKEVDRAKNQFLMLLSHELKTPLTNIIGWAQAAEGAPELTEEALQTILRNARAQKETLDRLLILSRILTGKLLPRRTPVDLWGIVRLALDDIRPQAEQRRLTLTVEPPPAPLCVSGDAPLLRQAIGAVLNNAVKFTAAGGAVTVTGAREGGQAILRVRDTGRGIASEELTALMHPFQQISRDETLGGQGIGLALVRGILDAHGGQVTLASAGLGQGTTITITLPEETRGCDISG